MKKLFKNFKNLITSFFAVMIALLTSATNVAALAIEDSDLLNELATLTVDGVAFNEADYPANQDGNAELLNFCEYGYGDNDKYTLLLYVYAPKQVVCDDVRNTVQMFTGDDEGYDGDGHYAKFNLKLVSTTSDKRFAKFSVVFDEESMLQSLNPEARKYDISSIELYESGSNATSYAVEKVYTYTGVNDKLTAQVRIYMPGEKETVRLDVHHTTWRPEGTNGKDYTYDSIHSVYFAIPNEHEEKYDYLNSVKCEWYEAKTAPIFVCGDSKIYQAFDGLINKQGINVDFDSDEIEVGVGQGSFAPDVFDLHNFYYAIAAGYRASADNIAARYFFNRDELRGDAVFGDFYPRDFTFFDSNSNIVTRSDKTLFWNIFAGNVDYNGKYHDGDAYNFTMTASDVQSYIENYDTFYNDEKVAGKYASFLFDSYDTEKHSEVINVNKMYSLGGQTFGQTWWERFWGNRHHLETDDIYDFNAIEEITDEKIEVPDIARALYIDANDVDEFKAFYEANKDNCDVYLLRFATSEYVTMPALVTGEKEEVFGIIARRKLTENCYIAQTTAFLDFDIIDFEYVKNGEHYIVPVEMSPIDIFAPVTPPPVWYDFWKYGLAIIAGLAAVGVVYGIVKKKKGE